MEAALTISDPPVRVVCLLVVEEVRPPDDRATIKVQGEENIDSVSESRMRLALNMIARELKQITKPEENDNDG